MVVGGRFELPKASPADFPPTADPPVAEQSPNSINMLFQPFATLPLFKKDFMLSGIREVFKVFVINHNQRSAVLCTGDFAKQMSREAFFKVASCTLV